MIAKIQKPDLVIIGLGYVGLRVAVEMSKCYQVTAYDTSKRRLDQLKNDFDANGDVEIPENHSIKWVYELEASLKSRLYIVAVPTPVDGHKKPDLRHLLDATKQCLKCCERAILLFSSQQLFQGVPETFVFPYYAVKVS